MRLRRSVFAGFVIASAIAACVGDDPGSGPVPADASTGDSPAAADAGADSPPADVAVDSGPRCDRTKPFTKIEEVGELNGVGFGNSVARLTSDGLTVYFGRISTMSEYEIFVAKRTSRTAAFGAPAQVGLSRPPTELDSHPFIMPNGSALFFQRSAGGTLGGRDILRAVATGGGFSAPELVIGLSSADLEERSPWIAADGSMWLDTKSPDAGTPKRIAYALANGPGAFGALTPVDLATPVSAADSDPVLSADGLRLYFASTRPPSIATDVYVATRTSTGAAFGLPEPIAPLETDSDDIPSWISDDDCELWWSSPRGGTFRIHRIFRE